MWAIALTISNILDWDLADSELLCSLVEQIIKYKSINKKSGNIKISNISDLSVIFSPPSVILQRPSLTHMGTKKQWSWALPSSTTDKGSCKYDVSKKLLTSVKCLLYKKNALQDSVSYTKKKIM